MFTRIRAIHIAVNNVEETAKEYADKFGLVTSRSDTLPEMGIKNAILPIGDAIFELIEPLSPGEGVLAKFLERRGEGVYMMALEVENLSEAVESLRARGVRMNSDDPESIAKGGPVFVHPKSTHGVLIELIEKT